MHQRPHLDIRPRNAPVPLELNDSVGDFLSLPGQSANHLAVHSFSPFGLLDVFVEGICIEHDSVIEVGSRDGDVDFEVFQERRRVFDAGEIEGGLMAVFSDAPLKIIVIFFLAVKGISCGHYKAFINLSQSML